MNNSRVMLPTSIENASGSEEISKLWKNHFKSLFNCLKSNNSKTKYSVNSTLDELKVSTDDVIEAIKKLDNNKSCGSDNIYAEHLKNAFERLLSIYASLDCLYMGSCHNLY